MAGKGLSGQLNMFDFFQRIEQPDGTHEVEMVSLMPEPEEDNTEVPERQRAEKQQAEPQAPEPAEEKACNRKAAAEDDSADRPVMFRSFDTPDGCAEIAYLDYNRVSLKKPGKEAVIYPFSSAKEAVDFYMEEMLKLGKEN